MPSQRIQNPSKKELVNRLNNIREKLSSLRQEEGNINQNLSQEYAQSLSKCLMDTNAIEIDFNILLGGMLEVINQAQTNRQRPCPELNQRMEAWQKSGLKFCRKRRQKPTSIVEGTITNGKSQNKSRSHNPSARDGKNANTNEQ